MKSTIAVRFGARLGAGFFLTIASLAPRANAQDTVLGPLIEISRPNAVGTCNTGFTFYGNGPVDNAGEPFVAVNPVHPQNIVAGWIQGTIQDTITATSFDGGQNWQRVPLPLTTCTGGPAVGSGDPWLAFSPNGDLYAIAVTTNSFTASDKEIVFSKSTDGGSHWLPAPSLVLPGSTTVDPPADYPKITADPANSNYVYAVWLGLNRYSTGAIFTRSTDGGLTWESARSIFETKPQSYNDGGQILVLPDGTLVYIFEFYEQQPNKSCTFTNLQVMRSADHGQTWSGPSNAVTMTPVYSPSCNTQVVDPKTGRYVWDNTNAFFAVDRRNGNLYAVWEDGRFSNFLVNDIALSVSSDGGQTWSTPIRVNQTPINIPAANRQAFHANVAVAADGTVGVTYYDFRLNNSNPGVNTDYWLSICHPSANSTAGDPACWSSELRLTESSFNLEAASTIAFDGRIFLGDYFGLAASGPHGFVAAFTAVDNQNVESIFFRRISPE